MSWRRASLIGAILLGLCVGGWFVLANHPPAGAPACKFIVLDVGQGDALLLQTPDGNDMLVDGGPSAQVVELLPKYLGPGNNDLELVVLTHPDSDHLRGLVSVIERFKITTLLASDVSNPTALYHAWQQGLHTQGLQPQLVHQGQQFQLGKYLHLTVLWPPPGSGWKVSGAGTPTNDGSVSLHVTCAGSTITMTGDASSAVEDRIIASGLDIHSSLLKVGHHGSRTSSSHAYLQAVHPDLAVISVGAENRYGHPHPTTLRRFAYFHIRVLRTDQRGTIVLVTDGHGGWRIQP